MRATDLASALGKARRRPAWLAACAVSLSILVLGCSNRSVGNEQVASLDRSDLPLAGASGEELARFREGDRLFDATFREADGLGPLYIRASCSACHRGDARGPGRVGKFAWLGAASEAEVGLALGVTERPYTAAGARRAITANDDPRVRVTYRLPPAAFGRGYLDAVDDTEIERLAERARERSGPIRGRIHRVSSLARVDAPGADSVDRARIGRFGLKARTPTLEEFTAEAFQGDMGLTSPMLPVEPENPEGIHDDLKSGIDLDAGVVQAVSDYLRLLEIPARSPESPGAVEAFDSALCATCHVPSLRTRSDYPISGLAGIEAKVFTDFLLHDMGETLADGVSEGDAGPREWRTAPLIGLRFFSAFLHDGRARTVEAAILAHEGPGSEANESVARYRALMPTTRALLLRFVRGL